MRPATASGKNFIANATAVPDFANSMPTGIPDMYGGPAVMKADYLTIPFVFRPGTDTYLLFTPTPSVAFFYQSVPIGSGAFSFASSTWNAKYSPDILQIFPRAFQAANPPAGETSHLNAQSFTSQVSKFRSVSRAAELQCCMNETQWAGNILVWKTPLTLAIGGGTYWPASSPLAEDGPTQAIVGMEGVLNSGASFELGTNGSIFSTPANLGAYSQSMNNDNDFPFQEIRDQANIALLAPYNADNVDCFTRFIAPIMGFGSMDTIVMRVQVPEDAFAQSYIIKSWHTIEYQPTHSSLLYQFAQPSPAYDPGALMLYKTLEEHLPTAVVQAENSSFFDKVKGIASIVSKGLSYVPGPVGAIAGLTNRVLTPNAPTAQPRPRLAPKPARPKRTKKASKPAVRKGKKKR